MRNQCSVKTKMCKFALIKDARDETGTIWYERIRKQSEETTNSKTLPGLTKRTKINLYMLPSLADAAKQAVQWL